MKNFAISVVTLAAAACLVSPVTHAAPVTFLNQTIVSRIPAKDMAGFKSAVAQALNETPDGSSLEWSSRPGRGHQPVQVTFKPQQTAQTQSAGTCRLLSAKVSQLSVSEDWRFWFCKQADGMWKASGSQLP